MTPKVMTILKKSLSMNLNFRKRNFRAKPEAEWEFQRKFSDVSTKKKVCNSKLCPNHNKPNF